MVCLETTLLIDALRGKEEARQLLDSIDRSSDMATIASPSIMELISGAILNPKVREEKEKVIEFLSSFVVLDLDKESAILAGEIEADLGKRGETIEPEDIMIGAIALHNGETLVTRNKKHFDRIQGLEIESY
jgi:tRNA(fMet)-specific endonuclease VapC